MIKLLDYLERAFSSIVLHIDFLLDLRSRPTLYLRRCLHHLVFDVHRLRISLLLHRLRRWGRPIEVNGITHGGSHIITKLKGQYLNKIFEDMPHGIMKIANLPDNIFRCFFRDLFCNLDIHIAIDEIIGVDF